MDMFVERKVKILEMINIKCSIKADVQFTNGDSRIVHFPPFHRLRKDKFSHFQNIELNLSSSFDVVFSDNAEQPRIICIDNIDVSKLWQFRSLNKVIIPSLETSRLKLIYRF
jgi:hypothetical protein